MQIHNPVTFFMMLFVVYATFYLAGRYDLVGRVAEIIQQVPGVNWKKLKCKLTGGHRYDCAEITSRRIPERGVTCFIHRCVNCGEYSVHVVNDSAFGVVPEPSKEVTDE